MKPIFASLAVTAAMLATPSYAADNMDNYNSSLKCVSLHVIAGQVLGQDAEKGKAFADMQADEASDYFGFARSSRPTLSKEQVDADLTAQMDKDYARITAPGADIDAFLGERVPLCKALARKMR